MTGLVVGFVLFHPLLPCQALGSGFDSSSIKGEGYMVAVVLLTRVTRRPSGLRIKSAMTGWSCRVDLQDCDDATHRFIDPRLRGNDGPGLVGLSCCCPACGYCLKASMAVMGHVESRSSGVGVGALYGMSYRCMMLV